MDYSMLHDSFVHILCKYPNKTREIRLQLTFLRGHHIIKYVIGLLLVMQAIPLQKGCISSLAYGIFFMP